MTCVSKQLFCSKAKGCLCLMVSVRTPWLPLLILMWHSFYPFRAQLVLQPELMEMSLNLSWPGNLSNWLQWITKNHQQEYTSVAFFCHNVQHYISYEEVFQPSASAQNSFPGSNFLWPYLTQCQGFLIAKPLWISSKGFVNWQDPYILHNQLV